LLNSERLLLLMKTLKEYSYSQIDNLLKKGNLKYIESVNPISSKRTFTKDELLPFFSNNNISISFSNYSSDELKTISYLAIKYREMIAHNPIYIGRYATLLIGKQVKGDVIYYEKDDYLGDQSITFDKFLQLIEKLSINVKIEYQIKVKNLNVSFTKTKIEHQIKVKNLNVSKSKLRIMHDISICNNNPLINGFDDGYFDLVGLEWSSTSVL